MSDSDTTNKPNENSIISKPMQPTGWTSSQLYHGHGRREWPREEEVIQTTPISMQPTGWTSSQLYHGHGRREWPSLDKVIKYSKQPNNKDDM